MMKIAFNAKIIFESTKFFEYVDDLGNRDKEFTIFKFRDLLNDRPNIKITCILDMNTGEPVLVITQK